MCAHTGASILYKYIKVYIVWFSLLIRAPFRKKATAKPTVKLVKPSVEHSASIWALPQVLEALDSAKGAGQVTVRATLMVNLGHAPSWRDNRICKNVYRRLYGRLCRHLRWYT